MTPRESATLKALPARARSEKNQRFAAADGYPLAGTLYEPHKPNGISVLISPAYAVARRFYGPYARFLAGQGFTVLTYDYRGIGGSQAPAWRGDALRYRHWGERDLAAALDWLHGLAPENRLVAVGHSAGGHLFGLAPNNGRAVAMLAVASQHGYWALRRGRYALVSWSMFHVLVPMMAHVVHWLPFLRRGRFAVPRDVALEFSRFGRHPDYLVDERGQPLREHFHSYTGRVRLYGFPDDPEFAPPAAVRALASMFPRASVDIIEREPSEWGTDRIGHFGFFRAGMPAVAWSETAQWLRDVAAAPQIVRAPAETP